MPSVTIWQIVFAVLWPAVVTLEKTMLAPGSLQDTVVDATNSVFAVLLVIFRRPSTQGGTVSPAASLTVEGKPVGDPKVAAASAKK